MTGRPTDDELRQRVADCWAIDLGDTPIRADQPTSPAAWLALAERLALVIENAGHRVQPLPRAVRHPPLPARPPLADRPEPSPAEALTALLAWAADQGIDTRAIEVRLGPDGQRHVVARAAIAADQELVVIPRAALVTEMDVADASVGLALTKAAPPLESAHTPLALWLACERRDGSSRWRPYLDALPPGLSLPWFWPDDGDELAALRGTHVELTIDVMRGGVIVDHASVAERLPRLEVALGELAWGRAIASSRLFRITVDGLERLVLAPIADLFDHGPADAVWRYDEKRSAFVITAKRALAEGEAIHLSYGKKTLARYVTGYGFTPADTIDAIAAAAGGDDAPAEDDPRREDLAALVFDGLREDPRAALAIHLIWKHDLDRPLTLSASASWDDRARRVLSVARLLVADSRELIHATDRGRFIRNELAWLSPRNEKAALERIAEATRAAHAGMAASAEHDRLLLADREVTGWRRTAAALRTAERAVLDRWAELATLAAPLHAEKSPWAWKRAADRRQAAGQTHPLALGYLRAVADELPA